MSVRHLLLTCIVSGLVTVGARAETPLFAREVTPMLYRLGCSAGTCHGSFAGKGNFRLSLFAADPDADYQAIRTDNFGRRIDPVRPEQSLLLLKPTGALPHGGGVRLAKHSAEYRLLQAWIAAGLPYDPQRDGRVATVRVQPSTLTVRVGEPEPSLRAVAVLADQSEVDVTRWTRFESLDASVASVDADGRLSAVAAGDAAVLAHYAGAIGVGRCLVPQAPVPNLSFPQEDLPDAVDRFLIEKLKQLNIVPSPRCDDLEFMRRASLDIAGKLPTPDEVRRFQADPAPDRRARLIDRLLTDPLHASLWAIKLLDMINADNRFNGQVNGYFATFRTQLQQNLPWDQIAAHAAGCFGGYNFTKKDPSDPTGKRDIIDAEKLALGFAHAFLAVDIQCAQCHRHPNDRWTQEDFRSFASTFAFRVKKPGAAPAEYVPYADALTVEPTAPKPLGGVPLVVRPSEHPRGELVKWTVARANPYFARAMVNRVWAHYFGRGLVEPVDGLAAGNPPAHPEVLDELARNFTAHNYDLRHLHRRILNTTAYQRTWRTNASNARDERNFSHRILHMLPAEVVVDAINDVTGAPFQVTPFGALPKDQPVRRALDLPASRVGNVNDGYVLQIFGKPQRLQICDCERSAAPSISQVLYLYNAQELNAKIYHPVHDERPALPLAVGAAGLATAPLLSAAAAPVFAPREGRLKQLLRDQPDDRQLLEELYLRALTRYPTATEIDVALRHRQKAASRREAFQDIVWLLLNQKEFIVNH